MNDGYHAVGSALSAVLRRLEVATKDVINAKTPGYQKHVLTTQSFASDLDRELGRPGALVKTSENVAFIQGSLVPRASDSAIALKGPGFFAIETPDGTAYTRNGDLQIGADGTLRTQAGYPVLGAAGPLRLTPALGAMRIEADGAVLQGEAEVGRLRLVEFKDRKQLVPVADTIFQDGGQAEPNPASETSVHQQYLELPRGSTVSGMVEMIAAGRAFEAAQRVAKVMDETHQRLVRQGQ
jgi:flagellar basal-body rod protein FlgG